jgi:hypothetical protein
VRKNGVGMAVKLAPARKNGNLGASHTL